MKRKSLYRYFTNNDHAHEFMKGNIYFNSLSYFKKIEDNTVRGDENEGLTIYTPENGLEINNITQGASIRLPPGSTFLSESAYNDIFIFCLSRALKIDIWEKFSSTCYVEITDIPKFCSRITRNLPKNAILPSPFGKYKIGHNVEYYDNTKVDNGRYALPDRIAISKRNIYSWQNEFRILFGRNNAFTMENVKLHIVPDMKTIRNPRILMENSLQDEHQIISIGNITDIATLYTSPP